MADDVIPNTPDTTWVWQRLIESFSLDDINNLCFSLGIDHESVPGHTKEAKARELVIYCRNRGIVDRLVEQMKADRPLLPWPSTNVLDQLAESDADRSTDQRIYDLVQAFNKNRHQRISSNRTRAGDEIAFRMREMAPELDGRIDLQAWLTSDNIGKRVAAVEFLDWKQDTEYFRVLLEKLFDEQPFVQFRILIALNSLIDQLGYAQMKYLSERLSAYDPEGDGSRKILAQRLHDKIDDWFRQVE